MIRLIRGVGLVAALLPLGCGSGLRVTVQRYNLETVQCPTQGDTSCAQRAFAQARLPTPEALTKSLALLHSNVKAYGASVKRLNHVVDVLMSAPPSDTRDAAIDAVIREALEPVRAALLATSFQRAGESAPMLPSSGPSSTVPPSTEKAVTPAANAEALHAGEATTPASASPTSDGKAAAASTLTPPAGKPASTSTTTTPTLAGTTQPSETTATPPAEQKPAPGETAASPKITEKAPAADKTTPRASVEKTPPSAPPAKGSVFELTALAFASTYGIDDALKRADPDIVLPGDTAAIETVMGQLAKVKNQDLDTLVKKTRDEIAKIPDAHCGRNVRVTATSAFLPELLTQVSECHGALQAASVDVVGPGDSDAIRRDFVVSQDMADPFLAFIAAHPDGWVGEKPNVPDLSGASDGATSTANGADDEGLNSAHAWGDGDTEFVLVLEHSLDGHWKSVAVDPTKVIRARLRVGRSLAFVAAAFGGAAAGGVGVSLPKSAGLSDGGDTDPSVAKVTSEATWLKLQNEKLRSELARTNAALLKLQSDLQSVDPAKKTDKLDYVSMKAQLVRLLVPYAPPSATPSQDAP